MPAAAGLGFELDEEAVAFHWISGTEVANAQRSRAAGARGGAAAHPRPSDVVFGEGALDALPGLVRGVGAEAAFVVSDPGLVAAGVTPRALTLLERAGVRRELFDGIGVNPTGRPCGRAGGAAPLAPAAVVAIGGGSPIDAAKAIAFSAGEGRPPAPIVAVPTTAGTGTETNGFGVIEDPALRRKLYLGDASTTPRHAILDPALTITVPPHVTAACGIDVLAHAIESVQARTGNAYSAALALEAARLVAAHLPRAVADGADIGARSALLLAAHLAGLAFSTTGLGTAHAIGHALSARYGVPHGVALAAALPLVTAENLEHRPGDRPARRRARRAGRGCGAGRRRPSAGRARGPADARRPRRRPHDVPDVAAAALADEVIRNAPRAYSHAELVRLLEQARGG